MSNSVLITIHKEPENKRVISRKCYALASAKVTDDFYGEFTFALYADGKVYSFRGDCYAMLDTGLIKIRDRVVFEMREMIANQMSIM